MKTTLSNQELQALGDEGIIPAPVESEEAFLKEVTFLKQIDKEVEKRILGYLFEKWECDFGQKLGANVSWVPLSYSNRALFFWQGAALWTFEIPDQGTIPMIQLRTAFKKGRFFLSSLEEVLCHESVHALRARFHEPRFEEILAYYHAPSKWRRFWGPFFRTPRDAFFSFFSLFFSLFLQGVSFFFTDSFFFYLTFAPVFPLIDLAYKCFSLIKDQRVLKRALLTLCQVFPKEKQGFPIAVRLTDLEIQKFAKISLQEAVNYIRQMAKQSVRWRQIVAQFS